MTQLLQTVYDAVYQKLSNVNKATLSGAIDIVVVQHPPGSRPRDVPERQQADIPDDAAMYVSTPFHVRFGKLKVFKSVGLPVRIIVNGEDSGVDMKLGRAGEAFFVLSADESAEKLKQFTSPIHAPTDRDLLEEPPPMQLSPIKDEDENALPPDMRGTFDSPGGDGETPLDPKQVAEMNFMWWSWGWGNVPMLNSQAPDSNLSVSGTPRPSIGGVDGYHVDESGQVTLKTMGTARFADGRRRMTQVENAEVQAFQAEILREEGMRNKLESELNDMEESSRWSWLWSVWNLWKNKKHDVANDATASVKDYITAEEQDELDRLEAQQKLSKRMQNQENSDIAKGLSSPKRKKQAASGGNSPIKRGASAPPRLERVTSPSLTQEALETHSLILQENAENDGGDGTDNGEGSLITLTDGEEDTTTMSFRNWRINELANAILPSPSMVSNVQMSLCGHLLGPDTLHNKTHFEQNIVNFEALNSRPDIVFDRRLIILSNRKLYPARVALPLLLSFLAFQRPLSDDALLGLAARDQDYGHLHTRGVRSDGEEDNEKSLPVSPERPLNERGGIARQSSSPVDAEDRDNNTTDTPPATTDLRSILDPRPGPEGCGVKGMPPLEQPTPPRTPPRSPARDRPPPAPPQRIPVARVLHRPGTTIPKVANVKSPIPKREERSRSGDPQPNPPGVPDAEFEWSKAWDAKAPGRKRRKSRRKGSGVKQEPGRESPSPPPISQPPHVPHINVNVKREDAWEADEKVSGSQSEHRTPTPRTPSQSRKYVKTLRPTSDMLERLHLRPGRNKIEFVVQTALQGECRITAGIYLWPNDSKIIISDVDGTITRSDVYGHLMPWLGLDWSHTNVAQFFDHVERSGYNLMYLTARAIGQADMTREYLFNELKQYTDNDALYVLPQGPCIMAPDSLLRAAQRELILKRPQDFKIPALTDLRNLFSEDHNPFYAGFGNRVTDLISYHAVGVPKHRVFIIDPSGDISNSNNIEYSTTYAELLDCVDQMFPPRQTGRPDIEEAFTTFNYWKQPTYADDMIKELTDPLTSDDDPWSALDKQQRDDNV